MQKTVVLIDDDPDDLYMMREAINNIESTVNCVEFSYPDEAVQSLTEGAVPNYIFIDINMPRKSGVECLLDLQRIVRLKGVPMIMCSTSMPEKTKAEVLQLGAKFAFQKPVSLNEYLVLLKRILKD